MQLFVAFAGLHVLAAMLGDANKRISFRVCSFSNMVAMHVFHIKLKGLITSHKYRRYFPISALLVHVSDQYFILQIEAIEGN